MGDIVDLAGLRRALVGTRFGGDVRHFAVIGSTNTALLQAAAANAPEGTVFFADEQSAGRGRSDHAWHSAGQTAGVAAGLYVSVLVRPALRLSEALLLSLATGLAAQEAIRGLTGLEADLRWPNDLLLHAGALPDAERKVGGILVESAVEPGSDRLRHAVIGVGINLNQQSFPAELATLAISLRMGSGAMVQRQPLLVALLRALDRELALLEVGQANGRWELLSRFAAASSWVCGRRVSVPEQGGYTGVTCGLDDRGFLQVDAEDGVRRTVLSGGVRALPAVLRAE